MDSNFVDYFAQETNKKFDELKGELSDIRDRVEQIAVFKVEAIVTARMVSLIVSAACGILTLVATVLLTYYTGIGVHNDRSESNGKHLQRPTWETLPD